MNWELGVGGQVDSCWWAELPNRRGPLRDDVDHVAVAERTSYDEEGSLVL